MMLARGVVAAFAICCLPLMGASQKTTFSGKVTDRRGDVRSSLQLKRPPDFVSALADVRDGTFTLTVSFAPGTLTSQTTITVYLDTDENAKTGAVAFFRDSRAIGADFVLRGLHPHNAARAAITRETPPDQSSFLGLVDVTFPSADQRRFVVPLARLGNDDGRLRFKVSCDQIIATSGTGETSTQTTLSHLDQMPNVGAAAAVVK